MTKIICDTNIWFNICIGIISPKVIGRNKLVLTQHCLNEIDSNPSLIKEFDLFVSICETVIKFSKSHILKSPLEHLLNIPVNAYQKKKQILLPLRQYAYNGFKYEPSEDIKKWIKNNINSFEEEIKNGFIKDINNQLSIIKANIKDGNQKSKHRGLDLTDLRKYFIQSICDNFCDTKGLVRIPVSWDNFHVFTVLLDSYFKKLETGEINFANIQDIDDLFHLVYVTPKTKFWTHEKKWIWMMRDCGLEEYLFVDDFVEQKLKENLPKIKNS